MFLKFADKMNKEDDGFTLIELLVVIIIIGILASIAIPVFLNQRQRGWRGAVQSDLRNHAIVMETQLTDTGTYANAPAPSTTNDVTITVKTADANSYCIQGYHANNATEIWRLGPGAAPGGLVQAACGATPAT